jgi:hypothetical protein
MMFCQKKLYGCGGYVGNRIRFNPLGEAVIFLCWREFANDVDAPPL